MSPKTSRASSRQHRSREKSGQGSAPRPLSRLRPVSHITSSSPNWPRITASRTGSLSSLPKWGRHSSRPCRSGSFTGSDPRALPRWGGSGSRPGSISGRRAWTSYSNISGKRAPTITGLRAASMSGLCVPIEYENLSVPRTRFPPISSLTMPRVRRFERLSTRFGGTAKAPVRSPRLPLPRRKPSRPITGSPGRSGASP
jgi:hypothetical protein